MNSLFESGQPTGAVKVLEKVLEYNPQSAESLAMIGMIHMETGDAEAAKSAFEGALALDPESPMAKRALEALANPLEAGDE